MSHRYHIQASPTGNGEWRADAKEGSTIVNTAFGLSRQDAISKVRAKLPGDRRFNVQHGITPNLAGQYCTVTDHKTGQTWTATDRDNSHLALGEIEKDLPKDYFIEKYPETPYKGRDEWIDAQGLTVMIKPVGILFVLFLIGCLAIHFTS